MFDSIHKENIKMFREVITYIVDSAKMCGCQNIPFTHPTPRDSAKNHPEIGKSSITNSGNLVQLLQCRVRGENKTIENHLQNAPWTSHDLLFGVEFSFVWFFSSISRQTLILLAEVGHVGVYVVSINNITS